MASYSFTTVWRLDAKLELVWEAVMAAERWPEWWPGIERVEESEPGLADGVGRLYRMVWRSPLRYPVSFDMRITEIEYEAQIVGVANGELAGEGRWSLFAGSDATTVRYDWNVRTTALWMNLAAPFAKRIFAWNHDAIMRQGGEGMATLLDARLLD